MAQQMMWNYSDEIYRGQADDGTIITVAEDAMRLALAKAGRQIFETEWWMETLTNVLEHWGIYSKRWVDDLTGMPRLDFSLGQAKQMPDRTSGPLSSRLNSGPLSTRNLSQNPPSDKEKRP